MSTQAQLAEQQRAHRVNLGSVASSIASETPMQVKKNPPVNEIVPDRNPFPFARNADTADVP